MRLTSYRLLTLSLALFLAPLAAAPHSDRLVAMVEKNPIMESELQDRFAINRLTQPAFQNVPYDVARSRLMEEVCLDKMNEVLWERMGFSALRPSMEQVKAFKNFYGMEQLADSSVMRFYTAKLRENEISRGMIQPHIELTDLEINTFARQKQAWQSLGALWSFRLAFFDSKPQGEPQNYKRFEQVSVDKIQPAIFRQIDWHKQGQWQYFRDDGEYGAFYLEAINVPSIALQKYNIELLVLQQEAPSTDDAPAAFSISRTIPLTVSKASDLSPELWENLTQMAAGETCAPTQISSQWYQIHLIEATSITESYDNLVEAQLTDILRQKKTEERLPSWYSDMKKNFYIQIIEP